ncbi:MAG: dTDP-glucose pyrophosphorylase [Klebsiella michiganensis]|uniref:dTDP-glucose pyrophosphorylase n=1 Tax=Klebsiella grimontii TaxID=2058152 RepID=UPI0029005CDD|nr:dTDP-glucose pyrophosphorylase [Klebsiella grimontii]MDU1516562.1 dTDP-glucose pyrophosphorylase [Klebsiella michiganensis]MDU1614767.1 dTDP-glucose pyrophosphorylase [Klebsiella michiganensis]
MSESPRLITTLAMPPINEVTVPFRGLNFLRPELLLDFVTISQNPLLAVTPVALLYSSVGVLQHIELRKLPIEVSGRVVYPISTLKLPAMRAKLVINAQSKRLKFLETLLTNIPNENVHGMQVLGLALEFTVVKTA